MEIEFEPDMEPKTPQLAKTPLQPDYQPLHPVNLRQHIYPTTPTPRPYVASMPPPGALPKIQNSFAGHYEYDKPSIFITIAKFLGIFTAIFVLSFIFLNGPALWKEFDYFTVTNINNTSYAATTPIATPVTTESRLVIPQIKVSVPVIWNVNDNSVIQNLEKGVVHYAGTALPGQIGNIFITGHSSYYPWAAGDYKDIFALLNKLKTGDKIYLQYGGQNFVYEVSGIKTVSPNDLGVLDTTPNKTLTLMTCVPVGTNLQRLIVTANQIL